MLNRSVLVLRPKPPYWIWVRTTQRRQPGGMSLPADFEPDMTAHLIPLVEDRDELEQVLPSIYRSIFEAELREWCTKKSLWPMNRSLATFREWFHLDLHSMIVDHCDSPLHESDEGDEFSGVARTSWLSRVLRKFSGN